MSNGAERKGGLGYEFDFLFLVENQQPLYDTTKSDLQVAKCDYWNIELFPLWLLHL